MKWYKGFPPFPWCDEWFTVKLDNGNVIQLNPLPEEFTYDWEDKEETYYTDERIKSTVIEWSQNSDSAYVEFNQ